jgi:hypothetical protein
MSVDRFFRFVRICAACLAGSACSADGPGPEPPLGPATPSDPYVATVSLLGHAQRGVVGQPLPEAIGVRLIDQYGAPISGFMVKFAPGPGGGSVAADSAATDARGEALTSWTLGVSAAADYRVTVTVPGYGAPIPDLRASASAGPPFKMERISGDSQTTMVGTELSAPLRIRLTDMFENPVPGFGVVWRAPGGAGWVSADTTSTDWNGIAQVERTLGATLGPQSTEAEPVGGSVPPVLFASTATPLVSTYDIDLQFTGAVPPSLETAVRAAAARWSRIIVGDVPSASPSDSYDWCGLGPSLLPAAVDDISIVVVVVNYGPGGFLGGGYPCVDRPSLLTQVGRVIIDGSDLATLQADGLLEAVVLRAIGQAIGFGYLWPYLVPPLSSGTTQWDPVFVGLRAIRQFNLNRGASTALSSVPIEISTDPWDWTWALPGEYPYWREAVMGSEIMTSVLNSGANPLSTITIATFADMGYTVSYAEADPYTVNSAGQSALVAEPTSGRGMPPRRSRSR